MIRVLVVDDDFMVARVHRGMVERVPGFSVVGVAHTGTAALSMVDELKPDLVLLDVYMPDLSGIEVLRRLRGGDNPVDVLLITAARDAETIRTALRGGVAHYIIKPFEWSTLRERLLHYQQQHKDLQHIGTADQADIDRVFGAPSAPDAVPKGMSVQTAELVRDALRTADDGLSATDCAESTGLSRVSARRYLEYFAETGAAEVRLKYGTAGRPERRYHWISD
ncbi:response regulator [Hoyosella sp. YIM 151337]|uniref:response regulator n=1 Tax=Hoyosella sp. YIM 151337 TaxID=2992742 RepID=UPI002235C078|nr:response regulator [Hoyosella sp. YIM 151337]MCW4353767.1 response regulator [Hoyosella sp. YIM 151337]